MTPADAMTAPAGAVTEAARMGAKLLAGTDLFNRLRDADVQVATTPRDPVRHQDKVGLYRFRPLAGQRVQVLVAYGLIGRWTMTDPQDGRSLVRNPLNPGVGLHVVDWGPSRADRFLTKHGGEDEGAGHAKDNLCA